MPHVEASIEVKGPVTAVYDLAKNMERYPEFMKDVVSVKVIARDSASTITEWVTKLEGKTLKWKEKDMFDDAAKHIRYQQTEGDLKKFEGDWFFTPTPEGTKVTLTVDFEFGIPMVAALLHPIARIKVRENCEMMLQGIKQQVER
ncbi:MAG: type II toxin-antitoxin system RatA family toxin [bacterium]|jgi:coenzyme Q-binding protein COQ10